MKTIHIYCDGGFGNRYNCLVSGLALAAQLDLKPHIYWPLNNWCGAAFESLFASSDLMVEADSLTLLRGRFKGYLPMLHDEGGAQALDIPFVSAYSYANLSDVQQKLADVPGIIYYPALVPIWLPAIAIDAVVSELTFHPYICQRTIEFLDAELPGPYFGIHLRRTDLGVGLSDSEVSELVRMHASAQFFVCSDDPLAERLATAHSNVRSRNKSAWVGKRNKLGNWTDVTFDDDQRPYCSNIERESDSVIEAVIDLLVLAHSTIVGYSGSTFQAVARLIGRTAPLVRRSPLTEIPFLPLGDCLRQLRSRRLTCADLLDIGNRLTVQNGMPATIIFFQESLNYFHGVPAFALRFNLAVLLDDLGRHGEAEAIIRTAIADFPSYPESYLLAAQILHKLQQQTLEIKYLAIGLDVAIQANKLDVANTIRAFLYKAVTSPELPPEM